MVAEGDYRKVLSLVSKWPVEDRLGLVREVMSTIQAERRPPGSRPSFERAYGIARGTGPAPSDEQVRTWIDEHRMEKYGR